MTPEERSKIESQEANPMYVCGECGAPVIVFNGKVFRTCEHADAIVVANLSAVVYGQGSTV